MLSVLVMNGKAMSYSDWKGTRFGLVTKYFDTLLFKYRRQRKNHKPGPVGSEEPVFLRETALESLVAKC